MAYIFIFHILASAMHEYLQLQTPLKKWRVIISISLSLVAWQMIMMKTCSFKTDDKLVIMTICGFLCVLYCHMVVKISNFTGQSTCSCQWFVGTYNYKIIQTITVTSQRVRRCLKSPASRLFTEPFVQVQIKGNIKALCHWSLWGEFTGDWKFPAKRTSNAENVSILWRHHEAQVLIASLPVNSLWPSDIICGKRCGSTSDLKPSSFLLPARPSARSANGRVQQ